MSSSRKNLHINQFNARTHKHAETEKKRCEEDTLAFSLVPPLMEEGGSLCYMHVSLWQLILIMKNRRKCKGQRKAKKGGRGLSI